MLFEKYAFILKYKHLGFLMQVLNVDGIKFGSTKLKGYYTEKIKTSNMTGIKLVKHCNIFFQHLPA